MHTLFRFEISPICFHCGLYRMLNYLLQITDKYQLENQLFKALERFPSTFQDLLRVLQAADLLHTLVYVQGRWMKSHPPVVVATDELDIRSTLFPLQAPVDDEEGCVASPVIDCIIRPGHRKCTGL